MTNAYANTYAASTADGDTIILFDVASISTEGGFVKVYRRDERGNVRLAHIIPGGGLAEVIALSDAGDLGFTSDELDALYDKWIHRNDHNTKVVAA